MKIALFQMFVSGDIDNNFSKMKVAAKEAKQNGAEIIAFPECCVSGYPPLHHNSIEDIDIVKIDSVNQSLKKFAKQLDIAIVFGTITQKNGCYYNTSIFISSKGETISEYDKLHLMPLDKNYFAFGDKLDVFEYNGVTLGMLICYDARFPEPYLYLREKGAKLIFTVSNACGGEEWKRPVLEGTYRTRASENSCFIAAVNAAGPMQMANSRIVDNLGLDLAVCDYDKEELIYADIDISKAGEGYFNDKRTDLLKINKIS